MCVKQSGSHTLIRCACEWPAGSPLEPPRMLANVCVLCIVGLNVCWNYYVKDGRIMRETDLRWRAGSELHVYGRRPQLSTVSTKTQTSEQTKRARLASQDRNKLQFLISLFRTTKSSPQDLLLERKSTWRRIKWGWKKCVPWAMEWLAGNRGRGSAVMQAGSSNHFSSDRKWTSNPGYISAARPLPTDAGPVISQKDIVHNRTSWNQPSLAICIWAFLPNSAWFVLWKQPVPTVVQTWR